MIQCMESDCIFCKIVQGSIPADLVYSDENCVAFRDIHPQAPVHILVVTKRHFRDLPALCEHGDEGLPGQLLRAANHVARAAGLHEQGFRLVINIGSHGGQSVPHLHAHVLGQRPLGWPPG